MKQVNFLVEHLGSSQLSYYLINMINKLALERNDLDIIVFFNTMQKTPLQPRFAMMQMAEAWGQTGYTIATSFGTAKRMLTFPSVDKRIYYVWDLPWLREPRQVYREYANVLCNPKIDIVARSPAHAASLYNFTNQDTEIPIMEDFDVAKLVEVIDCEDTDNSRSDQRVCQKA